MGNQEKKRERDRERQPEAGTVEKGVQTERPRVDSVYVGSACVLLTFNFSEACLYVPHV